MRDRLRALLPRLHLLQKLSGSPEIGLAETAVVVGGAIEDTVERVGPDGDVFAVDASVDALEALRAASVAPNVFYLLGSGEILPLPDASIDVVIVCSQPADLAEAEREARRVLRPGGRLALP